MESIHILMLGSLVIERAGKPVSLNRRRPVALLAYLLLAGKPCSRASLAALFWPDQDNERAYASLRHALWGLNQMLGEGWVESDRETISLVSSDLLDVDVLRFNALLRQSASLPSVEQIAQLEKAVALYRGDFLSDFHIDGSVEYEDWQIAQSEHWRSQYAGALQALAIAHQQQACLDAALTTARRWLALDTLNEAPHRLLMELYALNGQRRAALQQYEACNRLLAEELGVEPEAATTALWQEIRAGRLQPQPQPQPVPCTPAAPIPVLEKSAAPRPRLQLPAQATPFVGRRSELNQIARLLTDPNIRLVTLVGAGGMGKTRLSLQAATERSTDYSHGATFVPLAAVSAPERIGRAIAEALQLVLQKEKAESLEPESEISQVMDYLSDKQILLVLDNFEHLLVGAPLLSLLLSTAPGVKLLVSSRQRLGLAEEYIFEVGGMAFPGAGTLRSLEQYSSVQLFMQHARRVQLNFSPTEADWQAIARICRLVEGSPLAIELAAVWVRLLTCPEIAEEIAHNLDFLTSSQPGVVERHRSLRAVFEYSWATLTPAERSAFCRLAVFRGGFGKQAAEQVAGASLPILSALVDKSLVRRHPSGRYDLHELLKQYAVEKLALEPDVRLQTERRHMDYYLKLLVDLAQQGRGTHSKELIEMLESEAGNLHSTWAWALEHDLVDELAELVPHWMLIISIRSQFSEGLALLDPLLTRWQLKYGPDPQDINQRGTLALLLSLTGGYLISNDQFGKGAQRAERAWELVQSLPPGNYLRSLILLSRNFGEGIIPLEQRWPLFEETLLTFQNASDTWGVGVVYLAMAEMIGPAERSSGRNIELLHKALEIFTTLGNQWGIGLCHEYLGESNYWIGNYKTARQDTLLAIQAYQSFDDPWRLMSARLFMGQIAVALGSLEEARLHYRENLAFVREMGHKNLTATHLDCLGYVDFLERHYAAAQENYQAASAIYADMNNKPGWMLSISNQADIALAQGELPRAQQLYQQALQVQEEVRSPWRTAVVNKKLAAVLLELGEMDAARTYLRVAYAAALAGGTIPEALGTLLVWSRFWEHRGDLERAAAALAAITANPATAQDVRASAGQDWVRLSSKLSVEQLASARQVGPARRLEDWPD